MRPRLLICIAVSLFWIVGCDPTVERHIVGYFAVYDSNDQEGGHFRLTFYDAPTQFNRQLFFGYVKTIEGDDHVLLVEGLASEDCNPVYYLIKHSQGEKLISVNQISVNQYSQNKKMISEAKYQFSTNKLKCP